MKKKLFLIFVPIFLLVVGLGHANNVQASSYLNGNTYAKQATRYVRVTKKMRVYRVRTGKYEAANRFYKVGYLKKGTKLHISYWIMSTGGGWVVKSKKYYHNRRTFFFVVGNHANWYKRIR